ncbi:MAG: hypothetical protein DDT23_00337 [candidate division WS2 bacterium]|nr:hypothetical protein [Candidatus Lithacetigena glycinireducens]
MLQQKVLFVKGVSPQREETNVPLDKVIEIFFSVPLDVSSLSPKTIIVAENNLRPITGSLKYFATDFSVKFTPDSNLLPETSYQVTIVGKNEGVRDASRNLFLPANYNFSFRTGRVFLLEPSLLSPDDQSSLTTTPTFRWSIVPDAFYHIQVSNSNTFSPIVWPLDNIDPQGNFITPDISFEPGMYYWRVRAVKGGVLSKWSQTYRFRIIDGDVRVDAGVERQFRVEKTIPFDGEMDVSTNLSSLKIFFSEDVNSNTVGASNINVVGLPFDKDMSKKRLSVGISGAIGSGMLSEYYLYPGSGFVKDYEYVVKVLSNSVMNISGHTLLSDYIFRFYTPLTYYYVDKSQIRLAVGDIIKDKTDLEIDRVIYEVSKDAYLMADEQTKRNLDSGVISKYVKCFVKWETVYRILNGKLMEVMLSTSITLGDFSVRQSSPDIGLIRFIVDKAKKDADECAEKFSDEQLGTYVRKIEMAIRDINYPSLKKRELIKNTRTEGKLKG